MTPIGYASCLRVVRLVPLAVVTVVEGAKKVANRHLSLQSLCIRDLNVRGLVTPR